MSFSINETLKVKGIAILLLLFHHLFRTIEIFSKNSVRSVLLNEKLISIIAVNARVCVWIFVFLSAFGLSVQYEKFIKKGINTGRFIWTRIVKLLIPYQFILLLVWGIIFFLVKNSALEVYHNNVILNMITDFFAISDLFGFAKFFGAYWYMCLALLEIVFLPAFYWIIKKLDYCVFPIMIILLKYINKDSIYSNQGGSYYMYIFAMLAGILFFQKNVFEKIGEKWKNKKTIFRRIVLGLLLIILSSACLYFGNNVMTEDVWFIRQLLRTFAAVLIIMFSYIVIKSIIIEKALVFLGKYSSEIFLLHPLFYVYFSNLLYWSHNVIIIWLCLVVYSLLAAVMVAKIKKALKLDSIITRLTKM